MKTYLLVITAKERKFLVISENMQLAAWESKESLLDAFSNFKAPDENTAFGSPEDLVEQLLASTLLAKMKPIAISTEEPPESLAKYFVEQKAIEFGNLPIGGIQYGAEVSDEIEELFDFDIAKELGINDTEGTFGTLDVLTQQQLVELAGTKLNDLN